MSPFWRSERKTIFLSTRDWRAWPWTTVERSHKNQSQLSLFSASTMAWPRGNREPRPSMAVAARRVPMAIRTKKHRGENLDMCASNAYHQDQAKDGNKQVPFYLLQSK